MANLHIRIQLGFNFYNGLAIGGGKGTGLIDNFVLKDYQKRPYIPGSSLKGRVRHNYSLLVNSFFEERGDGGLSRLFGQEGNMPGSLYFGDLKLEGAYSDKYLYGSRTGVKINRYSKQVKDQALFHYETSAIGENQKFKGDIEGYMGASSYKEELVILYMAIKMIETLGGNQSRGLGWLGDDSNIEIFVDDELIGENTLKKWGEDIGI